MRASLYSTKTRDLDLTDSLRLEQYAATNLYAATQVLKKEMDFLTVENMTVEIKLLRTLENTTYYNEYCLYICIYTIKTTRFILYLLYIVTVV